MSNIWLTSKTMTSDPSDILATKLNRTTLVEQVARNLVEFIESSHLKPGDTLPSTTKLATNFGVSRPVVREALKFLEAKGVIEISNGKKPMVKPITTEPLLGFFDRIVKAEHKALREFMEVRQGLEVQSAKLAAQRRTPEQLQAMKQIVAAMRENLHNPAIFIELDVELHLLIAEASHNTMMVRLIESIRETLKVTIEEGLRRRSMTQEQFQPVQTGHECIVAAIERGEAEEAGKMMRQHLGRATTKIWGEWLP
jgi:DNA-binding FadR family transcriptional regulator